jgi:hypothetical protein
MKSMTQEQFKDYCMKHDENIIANDEGLASMIKEAAEQYNKKDIHGNEHLGFKIIFICKNCGSTKIQIVGDNGCDYGGQTGYSPGCNVIKCLDCGNATSVYQ